MKPKHWVTIILCIAAAAFMGWGYYVYLLDEPTLLLNIVAYSECAADSQASDECLKEFQRIADRREKHFGPDSDSLVTPLMYLGDWHGDDHPRPNESVEDRKKRYLVSIDYFNRAMKIAKAHNKNDVANTLQQSIDRVQAKINAGSPLTPVR